MRDKIPKMTRLMKLVAMLRQNKYPNHRTLQRELQHLCTDNYSLSQKTVQRDVVDLRSNYAAPIEFDNGRRGYYLTDHTWEFEVPQLDYDEMRAITLGARLAETIMPPPISGEIQAAADNLLCANASGLPNATLLALVAQGARILVKPAIFSVVFEAWQNHRGLTVQYVKGQSGDVVRYLLEPHVLAFFDGLWYVRVILISQNGEDIQERRVRTLALHRFQSAEPFPGRFEPDARLIAEVNEERIFDFPTTEEVVLRFTDKAVSYARESYDPGLREEQPDGSVLVTLYDAIDFKVVNLVLNEGGDVQVISPPELANQVIEKAKKVIKSQKARH